MWDLIVSVPDHCLSFYFEISLFRNLLHPLSDLGTLKPSSNFSTLSIGVSVRLTNYSHLDSCLRWFMGLKNSQMFIQTKTSQGWRS